MLQLYFVSIFFLSFFFCPFEKLFKSYLKTFFFIEPINTFHSRTCNTDDSPPIRLSYHGNVHYNSIIDPYNPTVGVGLGLAGYKPEVSYACNFILNLFEICVY